MPCSPRKTQHHFIADIRLQGLFAPEPPQPPWSALPQLRKSRLRQVECAADAAGKWKKRAPDLRELQASWRTMEQYGAQIALHLLKLLCEPRLGAAKLLRSLPKGARPGQRFQELTVHHVHRTISI